LTVRELAGRLWEQIERWRAVSDNPDEFAESTAA
jgi:hypothetical protein